MQKLRCSISLVYGRFVTVQKQITLCNIKLKSGQINFIGRWWIKTQFIFQKNFCNFFVQLPRNELCVQICSFW